MASRSRGETSSSDSTAPRRRGGALAIAAVAALAAGPLGAQSAPDPDLDLLPAGPGSTMGFLVERTIFKVDVLYITVRVDEDTANGLERLVDGNSAYGRGLEDSVAALVRAAPEAVAEIRFVRDVSLEQFLEGVDEDMASARDAGWITPETFDEITSGLRDWFSFLEAEGIASGDRLTYHVRGDTLRTTYRRDGAASPVLDQTDIGDQNVQALWGGYFAPGSSFRESLVRSLWEGG